MFSDNTVRTQEQNYLCCSNISTVCSMLQKNLYEVYEGFIFLKTKRNLSSHHEIYTFSINLSFLIFTFIPLQVPLNLSLFPAIKALFWKDKKSLKNVYLFSRQKRKISSELLGLCKTFNLFTSDTQSMISL